MYIYIYYMFAIIWILDCWLPDTCLLETNAVSWPGKLLSVNALAKPYSYVAIWALIAVCISPGPRGSSYGLYQADCRSNLNPVPDVKPWDKERPMLHTTETNLSYSLGSRRSENQSSLKASFTIPERQITDYYIYIWEPPIHIVKSLKHENDKTQFLKTFKIECNINQQLPQKVCSKTSSIAEQLWHCYRFIKLSHLWNSLIHQPWAYDSFFSKDLIIWYS